MKTFFKILAGVLLIINGMGALYGGLNLIVYPNGNSLQLPLEYLQHSPFNNYFIPGVILFVMNGLSSLFICVAILLDSKRYAILILMQGCILACWIFIQILMLQSVNSLHLAVGITALLLMLCGQILLKSVHHKTHEGNNRIKIA